MAVEEHRRIALHRAAADSWGAEVADTLMDSIAPSGHELATRQDIEAILAAMDAMDQRWEERFAVTDQRIAHMDERWDERLTAMDQRWNERLRDIDQRWDERLTAMDQRWNERLRDMGQRWDERFTAMDQCWDERFTAMDQRWDERFTAMDQRWDEGFAAMDQRAATMDQRWAAEGRALRGELTGTFENRIADAITMQTRVMTISLMVTIVAIAGLAFGLN